MREKERNLLTTATKCAILMTVDSRNNNNQQQQLDFVVRTNVLPTKLKKNKRATYPINKRHPPADYNNHIFAHFSIEYHLNLHKLY